MGMKRDTYKYHLMIGRKVVDRGICQDPEMREAHHQTEFPGSRIKVIGRRTTREAALRWERRGAQRRYRRQAVIDEDS